MKIIEQTKNNTVRFHMGVGYFVFSDTEKYLPLLDRRMTKDQELELRKILTEKGFSLGELIVLKTVDGFEYFAYEIDDGMIF